VCVYKHILYIYIYICVCVCVYIQIKWLSRGVSDGVWDLLVELKIEIGWERKSESTAGEEGKTIFRKP